MGTHAAAASVLQPPAPRRAHLLTVGTQAAALTPCHAHDRVPVLKSRQSGGDLDRRASPHGQSQHGKAAVPCHNLVHRGRLRAAAAAAAQPVGPLHAGLGCSQGKPGQHSLYLSLWLIAGKHAAQPCSTRSGIDTLLRRRARAGRPPCMCDCRLGLPRGPRRHQRSSAAAYLFTPRLPVCNRLLRADPSDGTASALLSTLDTLGSTGACCAAPRALQVTCDKLTLCDASPAAAPAEVQRYEDPKLTPCKK